MLPICGARWQNQVLGLQLKPSVHREGVKRVIIFCAFSFGNFLLVFFISLRLISLPFFAVLAGKIIDF